MPRLRIHPSESLSGALFIRKENAYATGMSRRERAIRATTAAIVRRYRPEKVILFGSAARGTERRGSDLDLLIIKQTKKKPMERVREVVQSLPHRIDTDVIVLTPAEVAARKREGHYLLREILRDGTVLYEKKPR